MRPNTRHYVLTLKPTMVFGKHFYFGRSIVETCYGIVHTFLSDEIITNTSHPELLHYVASFLRWWALHFDKKVQSPEEAESDPGEKHHFFFTSVKTVGAHEDGT